MSEPKPIGYFVLNEFLHGENPSQSTPTSNSNVVERSESLALESLHKGIDIDAQKHPAALRDLQRIAIGKVLPLLLPLNSCQVDPG